MKLSRYALVLLCSCGTPFESTDVVALRAPLDTTTSGEASGTTTTASAGGAGGSGTTAAGGVGGAATTTATTTTSNGGSGGSDTTTAAGGAGGATTTSAGGAGGATASASGGGGAGGAGGASTTAAGGAGGAATTTTTTTTCKPTTCVIQDIQCGTIDDGCGGVLDCGPYVRFKTCDYGDPHLCACPVDHPASYYCATAANHKVSQGTITGDCDLNVKSGYKDFFCCVK